MADGNSKKLCFVIGPIGGQGTDERRHANWLLDGIIKPVFDVYFPHYRVERADKIDAPGIIHSQVISRIIDAPLVIADMSLHNANAFYELAIRHMVGLPTIHMIEKKWAIPFDVAPKRAIPFSLNEYDEVEAAREALKGAVEEAIKPDFEDENPITHARGVVKLRENASDAMRVVLDEMDSLKRRLNRAEMTAQLALQHASTAMFKSSTPLEKLMSVPFNSASPLSAVISSSDMPEKMGEIYGLSPSNSSESFGILGALKGLADESGKK